MMARGLESMEMVGGGCLAELKRARRGMTVFVVVGALHILWWASMQFMGLGWLPHIA